MFPVGVNEFTSVFNLGVNPVESNFIVDAAVPVADGTNAPADIFNPNLPESADGATGAPLFV